MIDSLPALQLTSRGVVAPGGPAATRALRDEFAARRCVRVISFFDRPLLARLQQQIEESTFVERVHGTIATELCMRKNACLGLLHFLVNDPAVFRFVEQISACEGLMVFLGRVYRMRADCGHYDAWHDDVRPDRRIGMSVNLGTEPFEGGVFELRRAETEEPLAAIANVGPGDALLFAIDDELEHRVTLMHGSVAKTAFAGWFGTTRDYRDTVHQRTTAS
jgi:hypothetical protein